jgi:hypothetical protein
MWWLYLDESGDLGFDFVNAKPSKFFTVAILATSQEETNRAFRWAVKRTLRRKVNAQGKRRRLAEELKGCGTIPGVKEYVWKQVSDLRFGIYALTLNKRRVYPQLAENKERVYNYVARLVIDQLPFDKAKGQVQLIVDRSKSRRAIAEFNSYIQRQLQGRLDPSLPLDFRHDDSKKWPGLQLADLFAWGIFRKYERGDEKWLSVYKEKVRFDEQYL